MILFLDIDGVLHPTPLMGRPGDVDLFSSLHLFEEVLRRAPFAQVVISSSWRAFHPLDEMREYFSEDLRDRIVGATPVLPLRSPIPPDLDGYYRHAECLAWLALYRPAGTPWIAVDDDTKLWEPACANLFVIDPATALTESSARELLARLQAADQDACSGRAGTGETHPMRTQT